MSTRTECDGCGKELGHDAARESGPRDLTFAQGHRLVVKWHGPDDAHLYSNRIKLDFDLCKDCTKTAFAAIGIATETTSIESPGA
jgi:hypothetical protein